MTASLTSRIQVNVQWTLLNPGSLSTPQEVVDLVKAIALPDGTGAGAARKAYQAALTLAASSEGSIDLSGSLTDALGQAFVLTKIQALVMVAGASNPGNIKVLIGDAAAVNSIASYGQITEAANEGIVLQPGGVLAIASPGAGYTVTATTADLIVWSSSATTGTHTLNVYIIGN